MKTLRVAKFIEAIEAERTIRERRVPQLHRSTVTRAIRSSPVEGVMGQQSCRARACSARSTWKRQHGRFVGAESVPETVAGTQVPVGGVQDANWIGAGKANVDFPVEPGFL